MIDPVAELDVTWLHDRMHAVLPVDRERDLPIFSLMSTVAIVAVSVKGGVLVGLVLLLLPLVFRERRRVDITVDARHVTLRRWFLSRPIDTRFALQSVDVSIGEHNERFRLSGPEGNVAYQWCGSPTALHWVADQIQVARARAIESPIEDPPAPPPELQTLRRAGSGGPVAREDHLRDQHD
jgi:hypothetical protein